MGAVCCLAQAVSDEVRKRERVIAALNLLLFIDFILKVDMRHSQFKM
jgi:hypothetical protein